MEIKNEKLRRLSQTINELAEEIDIALNRIATSLNSELISTNEELTKQLQKLSIESKRYQVNVGKESRYLWDMLQEVSDYYYFGIDDEFDTDDCEMTSMTDIIDNLNVDQFLEAYKNWHKAQEQQRIGHMRDHLQWFCCGRSCRECPLNSDEFNCGRGLGFKPVNPGDKSIIPDKDVKKYYEKVREYELYTRRLPQPWECTLEGTIKVNGDLLGKVCGIKIDDDK